jgi:DNA-binding transcriptional LysR family regulator
VRCSPGALRDLRARHPQLRVSLSELEPHESLPALGRGDLDVAVVQDWAEDPLAVPGGLARRHLLDDTYDVALPLDHPLAARAAVAVKELADDDWIGWSAGQICHDWLVRTLAEDGVEPRVAHTASEHSTQLALVAAGLGAAVIPRLGREPAPAAVRFVPVDPPPVRRVFALWRESAAARPAVRAAVAALQAAEAS